MRYIERYIKTLSDDISINESKVKNSKSKYYVLNGGFKIRLSDHLSPLPTKMLKCALNIILDFNNKETFIVTINMQPIPIVMDRKQVKQYIEVLFTNYKLLHYFEYLDDEEIIEEDIPLNEIEFQKEKRINKKETPTLHLDTVTSTEIPHYIKVINQIRNCNTPTTKQLGKAITEICSIAEFNVRNTLLDILPHIENIPGIEFQDYTEDGKTALYETFHDGRYNHLPGIAKLIGTAILAEYLKNKNPNAHYPKNKNTVYTALLQLCEIHKDIREHIQF